MITLTFDTALLRRVDSTWKRLGSNRSAFIESCCSQVIDEAEGVAAVMGDPVVMQAFVEAFSKPGVIQTFASAMGEHLAPEQIQQVLAFMGDRRKSPRSSSRSR